MTRFLFIAWLSLTVGIPVLFTVILIQGYDVDTATLGRDLGAVWGGLGAYLIVPGWKALRAMSAPYRVFIYSLVCFTGVAATGVFLLSSASAQGSPNAFSEGAISLVGLIVTVIWASKAWASITQAEPETDPAFRQKHQTFGLKAGAVMACALVSIAAFGICAGRAAKVDMLLKEVEKVGLDGAPKKQRFMQLARDKNSAQTPAEYLQRCAELEPATNDYEASERQMDGLLSQLQQETGQQKPGAVVTVMRAVLAKDLEAAAVYRKEFGYAKQLPGIPESQRIQFYKTNIEPVLEQEDQIAKDEVGILKDAKARGVKLPESLYQDAGIN